MSRRVIGSSGASVSATGPALGGADAAQPLGQHLREAAGEIADARLGQGVRRAQRERADAGFGAMFGHGRDDQHAGAAAGADDVGQRLEPRGAGHLDVEEDDVDDDRLQRVQRLVGIGGHRDDLEILMHGHHAREHGARHLAVVDDHQTNGRCGRPVEPPPRKGRGGTHATPTICNLE